MQGFLLRAVMHVLPKGANNAVIEVQAEYAEGRCSLPISPFLGITIHFTKPPQEQCCGFLSRSRGLGCQVHVALLTPAAPLAPYLDGGVRVTRLDGMAL